MNVTMKKLDVIFTVSHANTLGNANRIEMVRFLQQHFKITFYSNQADFLRHLFPSTDIIPFLDHSNKKGPGPINELRMWRDIATKVSSSSSEAVLMVPASPASLWINKPVFQYIHQFGNRAVGNGTALKSVKSLVSSGVRGWFLKRGLAKSTLNFTVSRQIIDHIGGSQAEKYQHIPHAVDLEKFRRPQVTAVHKPLSEKRKHGYFLVVYAGWMAENRGFILMLETIRNIVSTDKEVALVLAGADEEYSEKIKRFSEKEGLQNHIIDLGMIGSQDIPGVLHHADVCLSLLDDVPAFHLSPPQKVIEYFAAGKPVVCNDITTHGQLVDNEKDGLITAYNVHSVSQAILRLKRNRKLLKTLSANAAQKASEFDLSTVYGGMLEQINHALHNR